MKYKTILFLFFIIPLNLLAQFKESCFYLPAEKCNNRQSVQGSFTSSDTIPLSIRNRISDFAVSGKSFLFDSDNSLVRIILRDSYGVDYLIYEANPLMVETSENEFQDFALETQSIDAAPQCLIIQILNARLNLNEISYHSMSQSERNPSFFSSEIFLQQQQAIIARINANIKRKGKHWCAGMTSVSAKSYEEKKSIFGENMPYLGGFEYYKGGVFELPGYSTASQPQSLIRDADPFIPEWDWRNRHGKNWITPAKDQGNCQSCWAFGVVGLFETYINLYYNQLLNYDLSEQQIVSCASGYNVDSMCLGNHTSKAFKHIKNNGIITEDCFPYVMRTECSNACDYSTEILSFDAYSYVYGYSRDSVLKKELFKHPVTLTFAQPADNIYHLMVLCGYKKLQAGDVIHYNTWNPENTDTIGTNDPLIGETVWLLKNSLGTDYGDDGFIYMYLPGGTVKQSPYRISGRVYSQLLSDNDIVVSDADGDGYYFWGIGPKPSHCPSWAPDEPDGDDSDYTKGPIDHFGYLTDINPNLNDTIYITENTTWGSPRYLHNHVKIVNGATLTIQGNTTCYTGVSFTLTSSSKIILDGTNLRYATLKTIGSSQIDVINNGALQTKTSQTIPIGCKLNLIYGRIEGV